MPPKDDFLVACTSPISNNMFISTENIRIKKARENILEVLLMNHPLDCPICDQGGECDLQDQSKKYGKDQSKIFVKRRGVEDKYFGSLIKTIMTRCIHCTRCVRFGEEYTENSNLTTLFRGSSTEIGYYVKNFLDSTLSGNAIDLCPVGFINNRFNFYEKKKNYNLTNLKTFYLKAIGAITSKDYSFKARP
jgi:NADH dehydrogenase/NADH:ubiquinone oxidoreductase subunit G